MIVCVWAENRERAAELLDKIPSVSSEGSRNTWRLVSAYNGPVGHACYAPDHPEIESDYADAKLLVLRDSAEFESDTNDKFDSSKIF